MKWWLLIITALLWILGGFILTFGLSITNETHKRRSIFDYASEVPILGDFSIFGFIFDLLFSLTIGLILKISPWWLAKTLIFLVACGFFYLGILVLLQL
jgi:hypothetical protein